MNTSGVYGMGVNTYAYTKNSKKTTETGCFADEMQKAEKSQSTQTKSNSSAWAGDMVIPQPPTYRGWYRSTCVGGALTITEECFERMKNDPEWEKTVLVFIFYK